MTSEYVSSMTSHSKDMMNYIWSGNGEYRAVKVWVDTGRYSGGYFEKAVYHKDSKQYQAYGNWVYETFVPGAANVQAHADKLELIAGIVGAANQSYNPYTGAINQTTTSQGKGSSTSNDAYSQANSSIGNTGQGSVGNSTSPSGQVTSGNSTTNGYIEPGNTNPGYVPPSTSNGIGTGTIQGSGDADFYVGPDGSTTKSLDSYDDFLRMKDMSKNEIVNQILNGERIGSGLKDDIYHRAASFLTREQLMNGKTTVFGGKDVLPYIKLETSGTLNGVNGTFEYIINSQGQVTHQLFIPY